MTDFSVADHLDDRTREVMLELARHATIGEPVREVIARLDDDTE